MLKFSSNIFVSVPFCPIHPTSMSEKYLRQTWVANSLKFVLGGNPIHDCIDKRRLSVALTCPWPPTLTNQIIKTVKSIPDAVVSTLACRPNGLGFEYYSRRQITWSSRSTQTNMWYQKVIGGLMADGVILETSQIEWRVVYNKIMSYNHEGNFTLRMKIMSYNNAGNCTQHS